MLKRLISWFENYKCRNLIYQIEDSYVIITGFKYGLVRRSIRLPKTINGYTVLNIDKCLTRFSLGYINSEKIKNSFHIINNRFIYKNNRIYRIEYNIGDDYYVSYYLSANHKSEYSYIIGGTYNFEYYTNFIYIRS